MDHPLIQQAQIQGTPLIKGNEATFVWHGKRIPCLVGDFNDWENGTAVKLTRIAPYVWQARLTFPQDAYIEYEYLVNGQPQPDPFNLRRVSNGLGKKINYFYMPDGKPSPLLGRWRGVKRGLLTSHQVQTDEYVSGAKRRVYLYQPATLQACPLLVVWDGVDYLRRAYLVNLVDNLISQARIQPLAMALVQNGKQTRNVEYACSEATLAFLLEKVLPLASENLNLLDLRQFPGAFGVLGASMGGVMALFTGLRCPQIFGRVLCQSAAFYHFSQQPVVADLIRQSDRVPLKIWMDAGRYENLIESNRALYTLLSLKGYPVAYHEYNGGHSFTAWGNDAWRGLEALFGEDA
jgi:enterochelin esterase family protein